MVHPPAVAVEVVVLMVVNGTGLRKVYRMGEVEVEALAGVDIKIKRGEFVTVTGTSGSGKSTVLSIIGCLDRVTSGSYSLMDRDVEIMSDSELASVRNQFIGFVFQTFNLLPRATSVQNVELPLIYAGEGRRERREKAMAMLEKVGLGSRAFHRPSQLSGGERQRVAIARALVTEPALLLADEPTGNLDSTTGNSIMELFQSVHNEGKTILLVTHDPEVAVKGTRTIQLKDGLIERDVSN